MAALPKFSFSGWTSQSLAPKINPATVPPPRPVYTRGPKGQTPAEAKTRLQEFTKTLAAWDSANPPPPVVTTPPPPGASGLVGTTNAANPNLPAWLQAEVDRLNAQDALRTQMAGQVTGGAPAAPAFDPNIGVAAVTAARSQFNTSLNQINEQSRLQNLIQQQNQLRPQGFGFMNPFDTQRSINLGREIDAYRNVNLPLAAGAVGGFRPTSGWVQPMWR